MPKSVWSMSPGRITPRGLVFSPCRQIVTDGWNHLPSPISTTRWRIHHTTSSLVVLPGVITLFENASRITMCATFIAWRYASSSSGSLIFEPADREHLR